MSFAFGKASLARLEGLHPDLIQVAQLAIRLTRVDFGITEGLRDPERQKVLVAAGASQTQRSRHLTGHAIDCAAYLDGTLRWEWVYYPAIAHAFRQAGQRLQVPLTWGGVWDRALTDLDGDLDAAHDAYAARFRTSHGRGPLVDGPHFELLRGAYPDPADSGVVTA